MDKRALLVSVVMIFLSIGLYHGFVAAANHLTRGDVGRYVTNISCGQQWNDTCPDEMQCFSINEQRLGRSIDEPHCVEPGYASEYCGVFESAIREASFPAGMTECETDDFFEVLGSYREVAYEISQRFNSS